MRLFILQETSGIIFFSIDSTTSNYYIQWVNTFSQMQVDED